MLASLHVAGDGPLHRISAGVKLAGLSFAGITLFFVHSVWLLAVVLALAAVLYFTAGLPIREAVRRIRLTLYSLFLLTALNLLFLPPAEVLLLGLRFLALVLLAAAVTATTPLDAIIDVVNRLLGPLERRRFLRPGDAGLMVGLCLRFVPEIFARYRKLAEAHNARGIKPRPVTLLGPLIIQTLKQADDVAAAIDARGLRASRITSISSPRDEGQPQK